MIGMTMAGFICGLGVNLERIGRIARWKAQPENERPERSDPQDEGTTVARLE